jgi:hypothetical protein
MGQSINLVEVNVSNKMQSEFLGSKPINIAELCEEYIENH